MGRSDTALGAAIARLRAGTLATEPAKYQRGIRAAEAKAVRHYLLQSCIIDPLSRNRHTLCTRIKRFDVGRGGNKV